MTTSATTARYRFSGSKPAVLMAHTVAQEYQMVGVTAKEFLEKHTGMDFNLIELQRIFKTHCDDYMNELQEGVKSKAVEFCLKVIYEVEPESRKVKKGTGDKVWKFIFKSGDVNHYVFIATYKQENAEFKPENTPNTMILSLKQAALLVHETLARLVQYEFRKDKILMTPLAGACFCKEDLGTLAEELGVEHSMLVVMINQSTQVGGHYLPNSDVDIAICAAYAATKNVKDENLKKSIVVNIIKQYMTQGHVPDKNRIRIISRYATGGIPSDFSYESISELINTKQRTYAAQKIKELRFVASIFLTSVRASSWPYHEIVGVGQSAGPLLVAPVYGVAPAVSLLPAEPAKKAQTIVAGPVTKTVVEGSSSGPVTIVSPGTPATSSPPPTTLKPTIASAVPEDTVLVKGASAGAVTLVAPSDNSVAIADTNNAASAEAETKKGAVAASAKAVVAIESAEESSTTKASTNVTATAIRETIGIASANAVIGPSTGPIIIAGPTVPPIPVPAAVEASTPEAVTAASVAASATAKSASVSSSAVANVSVSSNISAEQASDVSGLASDTTEPTRIEGSASSSSTVTSTSGSSTAFASARINLISPLGTIALGETPLSNVVVSTGTAPPAIVSGPSGSVSTGSASQLLLKVPLYHL